MLSLAAAKLNALLLHTGRVSAPLLKKKDCEVNKLLKLEAMTNLIKSNKTENDLFEQQNSY